MSEKSLNNQLARVVHHSIFTDAEYPIQPDTVVNLLENLSKIGLNTDAALQICKQVGVPVVEHVAGDPHVDTKGYTVEAITDRWSKAILGFELQITNDIRFADDNVDTIIALVQARLGDDPDSSFLYIRKLISKEAVARIKTANKERIQKEAAEREANVRERVLVFLSPDDELVASCMNLSDRDIETIRSVPTSEAERAYGIIIAHMRQALNPEKIEQEAYKKSPMDPNMARVILPQLYYKVGDCLNDAALYMLASSDVPDTQKVALIRDVLKDTLASSNSYIQQEGLRWVLVHPRKWIQAILTIHPDFQKTVGLPVLDLPKRRGYEDPYYTVRFFKEAVRYPEWKFEKYFFNEMMQWFRTSSVYTPYPAELAGLFTGLAMRQLNEGAAPWEIMKEIDTVIPKVVDQRMETIIRAVTASIRELHMDTNEIAVKFVALWIDHLVREWRACCTQEDIQWIHSLRDTSLSLSGSCEATSKS
jgi:hypothetical protein